MSSRNKPPAAWGVEYGNLYSEYAALTSRIEGLLRDVIGRAGISVVQIECRTKSVESFVEKLRRKRGKYKTPLTDVTDLIGLRVITYYLEDIVAIGEIIDKEFDVDTENTVDKTQALGPTELGYLGVHYVVSLGKTREDLPEWTAFRGKRAEIQVRTAAQHAWAAVDHKLNYKATHEIPRELRRSFYLLGAVFELADDQFSRLRREHEALEERYSASVREGELNLGIDATSLTAYMEENRSAQGVKDILEEYGWKEPSSDMDPVRAARDRRDLLSALAWSQVTTIEELNELIGDEQRIRIIIDALHSEFDESESFTTDFFDDVMTQILFTARDVPEVNVKDLYESKSAASILRARKAYKSQAG